MEPGVVELLRAHLDRTQPVEDPAQLRMTAGGWYAAHASGADDLQRHPVASVEVVLGDRPGGTHGGVEARRNTVDATAVSDVAERVGEKQDVAIVVGPRGGDVQGAGAHRARPVHPTQSVARLEQPDAGEFVAIAGAGGAVDAHETECMHAWGRRIEGRRQGQRRHGDGRAHRGGPSERRPSARDRHGGGHDRAATPPGGAQPESELDGTGDRVDAACHGARARLDLDERTHVDHGAHVFTGTDTGPDIGTGPHAGQAVGGPNVDLPRRRLTLSHGVVVQPLGHDRVVPRARPHRPPRHHEQRRGEYDEVGPPQQRPHHGQQQPTDGGAHVRDGRLPRRRLRQRRVHRFGHPGTPPALGVATVARTSAATDAPEALLIHSSGRTVMRWASTAGPTVFTSSGVT